MTDECTCGHPGLTYAGPERDCPIHGENSPCPGTGQRTARNGVFGRDRCPVCARIAYVRLDGTTGSHR